MFSVYFADHFETVKAGYKSLTGGNYYTNTSLKHSKEFPYSMYGARLNQVDFTKKPFIGSYWHCVLDIAQQKTDKYTFKVKVRRKDGKIIEKQTEPIKIKG